VLSLIFISGFRFIFRYFYSSFKNVEFLKRRIIAVGAGELGNIFYKEIQDKKFSSLELVGFLDDHPVQNLEFYGKVPVLGTTDDLIRVVKNNKIDEIFITINNIEHDALLKLINKCRVTGCNVNIFSNQFDIIEQKMGQSEFKNLEYVTIYTPIINKYFGFIKRTFDVPFAIILLILLSPVLIICSILIKISSSGPVFYAPYAIGKNGKTFKFYKFRSMYHNSSNDAHKKLVEDFMSGKIIGAKLRDDQRVTKIGKFIRKHSIDEFPQLFNVIKGDMSLVGPRPSTLYEYEKMEEWHKKRFEVFPGMTGLWQVTGRAEVSFIDMIMMDIYYVENGSFWMDLHILFKTLFVVFKGKGGH
jgi:exopolysaccharide biosynthesis polyprenyl glycosylphosphotransferase